MFESIKKHFSSAKALSEVGHSLQYLNNQLENIKNLPHEETITSILFLYYYYNLEIITKCDDYDIGFHAKVNFTGSWIPIGSIVGKITTLFSEFSMKYDLQNEFQEIMDKGKLYYECEEYYKAIKKEVGL